MVIIKGEMKHSENGQKVKASIQKSRRNPTLLKSLIATAIYTLELLVSKLSTRDTRSTCRSVYICSIPMNVLVNAY